MTETKVTNNEIANSGWQTPTLGTGWAEFDLGTIPTTTTGTYRYPRYIKDIAGVVHLSGLVKNNSAGSNTTSTNATIFTLPAGSRPGHTLRIATNYQDTFAEIDIHPTGTVVLAGTTSVATTSWIQLNNISFMSEQ